MPSFRQCLFWTHLCCGIAAGLVIFIMSVTGIVLAFERQITSWADYSALHEAVRDDAGRAPSAVAKPQAIAGRQTMDLMLGAVLAHAPGVAITAVSLPAEPGLPVAVSLGRERVVYLSPGSGAVMGEGVKGVREFFAFVTGLHRWFTLEGASRETARAMTGAANLVFVFMIFSGMYIWLPRFWQASQFRMRLWFKRGYRNGRNRDWTWHHVFGAWMGLPLLLITASAVVFSYAWANTLLFSAFGEVPQQRRPPPTAPEEGAYAPPTADFERLFSIAASAEAGWRSITLLLPFTGAGGANFIIDAGDGGQPHKQIKLTVDTASGAVLNRTAFADLSAGSRARSIVRRLHTGEVLGLPGQAVAAMASFAAVLLVWTGLALAWRRLISPLFARG